MEDKLIPGFFHEADMARMERSNRRLFISLIIVIVLTLVTNAFWVYEWMQYDYVDDGYYVAVGSDDGIANYIGEDGDIINADNNR